MKNNVYFTLVRSFLKENFSIKRLVGFDPKQAKVKAILIGITLIYALVVLIGGLGYLFYDLGEVLYQMGQIDILMSFICIYSIGLSMMITLFRASGLLFYSKDFQLLAPLPIKPRTVLLARITVLLIMLYATSFVFVSPIMFSYIYWHGFNILNVFILLIGFLFIPIVPVVIMSFVSLLIAQITKRMKYGKIMSLILMIAAFLGLFMLSFSMNSVEQNPLTGQIDLFKGISDIYKPFDWFRNAVSQNSIESLLYILISHGLILVLFIFGMEKIVHKTNQQGIRIRYRNDGRPLKYQSKSLLMTLVKKEFKKFFNVTFYAMNSGIGVIMMLLAGVASIFYKSDLEQILAQEMGANLPIEWMLLVLLGFCLAMTYSPAISLSLEGKNFWIPKSLPIPPKTIMLSKIVFNLILCVPFAIVTVVLFGISFQLSFLNQLLMMMLVIVFAVMISSVDAIINLWVPKFHFINEIEVIKQSAGAVLAIFGGFAIMIVQGFIIYLLNDYLVFEAILGLIIVFNILVGGFCLSVIYKKSDHFFRKYIV